MNNLDAYTVVNNHNSRPGPPAVRKVTLILPAYNEEVSTGSITLRSKQHADRVIVVDEGSTDRTAIGARKEPQINTDEHRYDFNNSINIFQPEHTTSNPQQQRQPLEVFT